MNYLLIELSPFLSLLLQVKEEEKREHCGLTRQIAEHGRSQENQHGI